MVMPSFLLQKPLKESKSKDHLKALEWRMELWQSGDLLELLQESLTIQRNLKSVKGSKTVAQISKKLVEELQKVNMNGALKLLTDNIDHGILPLNDDTISKLKMKHPQASAPVPIFFLPDEAQDIDPIRYKYITAQKVRKAAINTKGGSGKKPRTTSNSSRWNISRKVVVSSTRNDIIVSVGSLQVCAGHEAGCEALIHTMNIFFQDEQTEAVLPVDAANAFNAVSSRTFLHNIDIIYPLIATFVHNCYSRLSKLFVIGGAEIASSEGTTQGDPVAYGCLRNCYNSFNIDDTWDHAKSYSEGISKAAAHADDLTATGCILELKYWWDQLCELGPKFGYFPEASKPWLIIKHEVEGEGKTIFQGSGVQITTEEKHRLGASLRSTKYKEEYLSSKVNKWITQLRILSQIARTQAQAAHSAFITGFRHLFVHAYDLQCI